MSKKGNGYETQVKPDFVARLAAKEENSEFVFKPAIPRLKTSLFDIAVRSELNNYARSYKLGEVNWMLRDNGLKLNG